MADPAPLQIQAAIKSRCEAAAPSVAFFIDRDDTEPLSSDAGEIPGVIIRVLNCSRADQELCDNWRWHATIQFDCFSGGGSGLTIDAVNQATMTAIITALWDGGDATLGGLVEDIDVTSVDSSEQSVPDVGWAVVQADCFFLTVHGAFDQIVPRL